MTSKNEVATKALDGEIIVNPWEKGYKSRDVDVAGITKQIAKLDNEQAMRKFAYASMTSLEKAMTEVRNIKYALCAVSVRYVATTGKVDLLEEVERAFGLDRGRNRFREWALEKAAVVWDDKANEGKGGYVIDKQERSKQQKRLAKEPDVVMTELVTQNMDVKGERDFRPVDALDTLANTLKRLARLHKEEAKRIELADAQGKDRDDWSGWQKIEAAAKAAGISLA